MPALRTRPAPRPAGAAARPSRDRDGVFAAVLVAVFLHLLLYWSTPAGLFERPSSRLPEPARLELMLEPIPAQPELDERYVRAAPNVPEQVPERTRNISDRDQVAAQEQAAVPDAENMPYVEGDLEESNRLVQGNPFQEPVPPSPPAASHASGGSPLVEQQAAPAIPPAHANPDFIAQLPQTDDGPASLMEPAQAREQPEQQPDARPAVAVTSPLDGAGEARITTPPQAAAADAPTPRPRLRVERDTSFGPIRDNRQGVIRVGQLAFDAQYSEFGDYWRRVAEVIEARWRNLVYNTRSIPFGGYRVVVQFAINRRGQVSDVQVTYSNAGRLAETISVDAIVGEAPFFEWTPEMIVRMGEQVPAAIHFFY